MASGITQTDGMTYNAQNGVPWHGIGVALDGLATMDEVLNAVPSLAANVSKEQILHPRTGEPVEGKFFTVREDIDEVLGIVGSKYQVLQNAKAFEFFDKFTADPHGPKYETAGTLWGGRKVFILAKLPNFIEVVPGDKVYPYILLSNSHDGSTAVVVKETPIRVVCQNTLNMAMRGEGRKKSLRHTGDILAKVEDVREALGLIQEQFEDTFAKYKDLAAYKPTDEEVKQVLETLIPATESKRSELQRERIMTLWENGIGANIPGVAGTAWGLYNAFTEMEDHHANVGSKREDANDMRTNNIWFGAGADRKQQALDAMLPWVAA